VPPTDVTLTDTPVPPAPTDLPAPTNPPSPTKAPPSGCDHSHGFDDDDCGCDDSRGFDDDCGGCDDSLGFDDDDCGCDDGWNFDDDCGDDFQGAVAPARAPAYRGGQPGTWTTQRGGHAGRGTATTVG
jgi:hypothetical protein